MYKNETICMCKSLQEFFSQNTEYDWNLFFFFLVETEITIEKVIVVILVVNYMIGYLKPGNIFRL